MSDGRWPPTDAALEDFDSEREPEVPGATASRRSPSPPRWVVADTAFRITPEIPHARRTLPGMRYGWALPVAGMLLAALGWKLVGTWNGPRSAEPTAVTMPGSEKRVPQVTGTPAGSTRATSPSLQAAIAGPEPRAGSPRTDDGNSATAIPPVLPAPAPPTAAAAGMSVSSMKPAAPPGFLSVPLPIQVEVYEGTRFIGINDSSRIALSAGVHRLDLVNDSLRFRTSERVEITSGRTTTLRVALPTGTLNLNALPWADVTIDGKTAGQTPLGNVPVPIGPHQIVFRHPRFGEQTRTIVVTSESQTRVAVDLRDPS